MSLSFKKLLCHTSVVLKKIEKIISKSKLTEAEALKIAKAVSRDLAERYKKLKK